MVKKSVQEFSTAREHTKGMCWHFSNPSKAKIFEKLKKKIEREMQKTVCAGGERLTDWQPVAANGKIVKIVENPIKRFPG